MPFDGITARAVARSLDRRLAGGRIGKIHQPERDLLIIQVRAGGANHRLTLSTNPASARVQLTAFSQENPDKAPMFCMLLRKHLGGAIIRSVTTPGPERILYFDIESEDELGDRSLMRLVVEIMGRHSNLMLVNRNGIIMDAMRHIDAELSRVREILPARPYELPPSQNKLPAEDEGLEARLREAREGCGRKLENFLLDHLQGFSAQLCREACLRAGLDGLRAAGGLDDAELVRLIAAVRGIADVPEDGSGWLVVDASTGQPLDFTAVRPFEAGTAHGDGSSEAQQESATFTGANGTDIRQMPSIHEAMDAFYRERERAGRLQQRRQDLLRQTGRELDTVTRLIGEQVQVLDENAAHGEWRKYGELLTAFVHQVEPGATETELPDYLSEAGGSIRIPLDENLSPQKNAQLYYRRYQKGKSAVAHAQARLEKLRAEADWLESVRFGLELADSQELLDQVKSEMSDMGYRKGADRKDGARAAGKSAKPGKQSRPGKPGKGGKPAPQKGGQAGGGAEPLQVLSSDGYEILIGRNNRQNDHLTLRLARPDDCWFHIRNYSGSHVVVRTQGGPVPARTMEEAAAYAAWYSRARQAGKAEVDWTRIRHVRKPSGGKPGMVIYVNQETIVIAPKEPRPAGQAD